MLESTAKLEMDRWIVRVKLAKLGTVNSTEQRNPKEPTVGCKLPRTYNHHVN